jgi:ATP-binding cassette, subfamily B, bacterial MsbA
MVLKYNVNMSFYQRITILIKPHWRRMVLAMLCMSVVAGCTAVSAYLIKPVLDDIFLNKKVEMLRILPLLILAIFFMKGLCSWWNTYLMSYVGNRITIDLRQQLYNHIQDLPLAYFDRTPTGTLMSHITNDVSLIQSAVTNSVTSLLRDSLSIVGLAAVIIYRDWQLAVIAMLILPFAFYPIVEFGRRLRIISTKSLQSIGQITVILHETISGNRIVKAFGMEDYEKDRFAKENAKSFDYAMRSASVGAISPALMEFLGGVGIVAIIWYGGYSVIEGISTPGNFFSFLAALILLYEPVKRLSGINNLIQQGMAAAFRVYEILDTPGEIHAASGGVSLAPLAHGIEFRHVFFNYGDKPVLEDINFRVAAGEIIAIVGVSGAGKTTLVNMIPRFYEVTEGTIAIDGVDIRNVSIKSLRAQIGIVTQQTILFNDTVRNNIAYGDIRRGEQQIIEAAKAANALDFIMKMPQGFDSVIGEQGVRLSGGERQRICIARALLKDAPILILDEATSSLDSESELEVQKALENLMTGRTTLVIAHRLSTIKNADRIIALADGRIVEEGRHDELLRADSEYRRLYELQFAQFDVIEAAETTATGTP